MSTEKGVAVLPVLSTLTLSRFFYTAKSHSGPVKS
jgi:hypothetical protein